MRDEPMLPPKPMHSPSTESALELEVLNLRDSGDRTESRELLQLRAKISQLQTSLETAATIQRLQKEKLETMEAGLTEKTQLLLAHEQTIVLQRKKVASLLKDNERVGAERESLQSIERLLLRISSNPHAALAELMAWRHLGMTRLAPTQAQATEQLDVLWNYVREMNSPGHRIVSFLGRRLGRTRVGRAVRRMLHFLYVMVKS
jgi:chromosome segregation ATPase